MIYLTTGANGSFKTCSVLWDVRQQQLKENRPVFYHGFKPGAVIDGFGWKPFDPKKWQELPDGSICIFDECQNEFPIRGNGAPVPDYVNAIAQHRRARGFDFWMITPHPMLLDVFVRRLIDNPSWHRHMKRAAGSNMVSVLKWNAVNPQCEKPGSGDSGEVTMTPARKEVFAWYESATMHTGKVKIPRAVFVIAAIVLAVPALIYVAVSSLSNPAKALQAKVEASKAPPGSAAGAPGQPPTRPGAIVTAAVVSAADYLAARVPRIEGFPHTAPAFDGRTDPVNIPYPAACLDGVSPRTKRAECSCFTQQGTRLQTPEATCRQIVASGFFVEWHQDVSAPRQAAARQVDLEQPGPVGNVTPPPSVPLPDKQNAAAPNKPTS